MPLTKAERSQRAKEAILAAARREFAARGYKGATIRAVAAGADIDPSMVIRYFGSKRDLFAAAAGVDLRLPDLTSVPSGRMGHVVAGHFLDLWEKQGPEGSLWIVLASAANDEAAREQAITIIQSQLRQVVERVDPDPATSGMRTGLIASHLLGLALCRFLIRLPEAVDLDRDRLLDVLGDTIQRYLTDDL